jgi:hypothetical protein
MSEAASFGWLEGHMRDRYVNGIIAGAWVKSEHSNLLARDIQRLIDVRYHSRAGNIWDGLVKRLT